MWKKQVNSQDLAHTFLMTLENLNAYVNAIVFLNLKWFHITKFNTLVYLGLCNLAVYCFGVNSSVIAAATMTTITTIKLVDFTYHY